MISPKFSWAWTSIAQAGVLSLELRLFLLHSIRVFDADERAARTFAASSAINARSPASYCYRLIR